MSTVHRNDPCPCGSGKKYKKCCMITDEKRERTRYLAGADGSPPLRLSDRANRDIGTVWQIDLAPINIGFADDPTARPAVVLVVAKNAVLYADIIAHPPAEYDEIATLLEAAVDSAEEVARTKPSRLELLYSEVATPLASRLADRRISVSAMARLPELDSALLDFTRRAMGKRDVDEAPIAEHLRVAGSGTWSGWGLEKSAIARIFAAAASYYRAAPWLVLADRQFLACQRPGGGRWDCAVLGNAGVEFGLGLHAPEGDVLSRLIGGGAGHGISDSGTVLSFTFDTARFLGRAAVREIRSSKWEVAGDDAYPFLMAINTPGGSVNRSQFEDLEAALLAIPRFVEKYKRELTGEEAAEWPITWTDLETGAVIEYAGFAHDAGSDQWGVPAELEPALPQGSNADPRASTVDYTARDDDDDDDDDDDGDGDDDDDWIDLSDNQDDAIRTRFSEHLRSRARKELLPDDAATILSHADALIEFLEEMQEIPLRAMTEYDLRVFLYDWLPREMVVGEIDSSTLPRSLQRFFRYLAEAEGIEYPWAESILSDVDVFLKRLSSSPGGPWWDLNVIDWRRELFSNLRARAFLHHDGGADSVDWSGANGLPGPLESRLADALQRQWLIWRDEEILRGITSPDALGAALLPRQLAWEATPNELADGLSPAEAIAHERPKRSKRRG